MTQNPAVQNKITVLNQHNEKLVGVLHDTGSMEIVVLCHGFRSSKDFNTMVNLAVALEKEGVSTFRFDFPGNGESEGSFQYGNYRREADDLHSVVEFFNGANRKVKAVLGHSKGGDVVLLYASKYHDVHTVINLSGRYNLEKGIAERLGKDFLEIIKKDGFIDVKNKAEIIPVEDALEFDKIIPNHKLHIIEGANHSYTLHQAELAPVILSFIKEGQQQN
ncbi:unnamed protein product [Withania somnifera]